MGRIAPGKKGGSKQASVKIPTGLIEAIDKFIDTDLAREMGLDSRTDVITMAVRDFLMRYGYYRLRQGEEAR